MNKMKLELENAQFSVEEIVEQLNILKLSLAQLHDIEMESFAELKLRQETSKCSKTGLKLSTEFNEMDVRKFNRDCSNLSMRVDRANERCQDALACIQSKQQQLMLLYEEVMESWE